MTDVLTPEQRRRNMAAIRGKDTKPELVVRSLVHAMGFRFRLHRRDVPGRPDLVFMGRRKVIFVHGCFWHRHDGCRFAATPKTRAEFWQRKLEGNRRRDRDALAALAKLGWDTLVIWECEVAQADLATRIRRFLERRLPHET